MQIKQVKANGKTLANGVLVDHVTHEESNGDIVHMVMVSRSMGRPQERSASLTRAYDTGQWDDRYGVEMDISPGDLKTIEAVHNQLVERGLW